MKKLLDKINARSAEYYSTLFTVGLVLAGTVVLNRRFVFLPDFFEGAFSGLSVTLMLIGGAFKRRKNDNNN